MKTLRLTTVLAAAGVGVFIGWTSLFAASFMAGKSVEAVVVVKFHEGGAA